MAKIGNKELLDAGVHFGHLKKKWNPQMAPYIFMEKKGIHLIDLNSTAECLNRAASALKSIASSGKKILFVATKKQAKEIIESSAHRVNMPFVTERWLGGMLTNFSTIRKSIKKIETIEKMLADSENENITKRERLTLSRQKAKMDKVLGGISLLNRLPASLFIVDISHEHIALAEAKKLNITTVAMVDTNSDPKQVDFPIPSNDDATKSIKLITEFLTSAIEEGLKERKNSKDVDAEEEEMEVAATENGKEEAVEVKPASTGVEAKKEKVEKSAEVKGSSGEKSTEDSKKKEEPTKSTRKKVVISVKKPAAIKPVTKKVGSKTTAVKKIVAKEPAKAKPAKKSK